ncbi:MAG: DUF2490 domain-containing protein [Prosthecobacter sp.]
MGKLFWFGFILLVTAIPAQADEWWAWSWLEVWRQEKNSAGLFLANRYDTDDAFLMQLASPRFKRELLPWLDGGIGLSLLQIADVKSGERHLQGRPELELNPHFDLTPHLRLDWRNRMEWRWNEEETLTIHRLRHRLQLTWTLPEAIGPWTRIFASNEWLTDLHRRQLTENRVVPLGLSFKTGKHTDLDLFYMIVSSKTPLEWRHESVLGTYLRVRF